MKTQVLPRGHESQQAADEITAAIFHGDPRRVAGSGPAASMHWRPRAFVFFFFLLFGAVLTFELVAKRMSNKTSAGNPGNWSSVRRVEVKN
jgi:hypothetical protein